MTKNISREKQLYLLKQEITSFFKNKERLVDINQDMLKYVTSDVSIYVLQMPNDGLDSVIFREKLYLEEDLFSNLKKIPNWKEEMFQNLANLDKKLENFYMVKEPYEESTRKNQINYELEQLFF